jgi:hypothetical protein
MLVDAQPPRELHRVARRRSDESRFRAADASSTAEEAVAEFSRTQQWLAVDRPCQEAFWW